MDDPKNGGRVQMNLGNFERGQNFSQKIGTLRAKMPYFCLFFTKDGWPKKMGGMVYAARNLHLPQVVFGTFPKYYIARFKKLP